MGTLQAHIRLDSSLNIRYALLPGDPGRIDRIAVHLQNVRELACNREYRSIAGTYKGVPILAVSTGIGGASMGIAVEELHACGVACAIRIGSCGALQHNIAPGELILAEGAVRDDGASAAYLPLGYPAVADHRLLECCCAAAEEPRALPTAAGWCAAMTAFIPTKKWRSAGHGLPAVFWEPIWRPQPCLPSVGCAAWRQLLS